MGLFGVLIAAIGKGIKAFSDLKKKLLLKQIAIKSINLFSEWGGGGRFHNDKETKKIINYSFLNV